VAALRAWLRSGVIQPRWTLRACAIVSALALVAIAVPSGVLVRERLQQDRVDIIAKYSGTAFVSGILGALGEKPDEHVDELRRIVSEVGGYAGGRAAIYLSKAREPASHVPLILDQLAREEEQARGVGGT
jgi:hypothetical protein